MIRLPPSSLSLSDRDIEFHLRQTHIYQGLLRQGFKKDDIIRYLNDYRHAAADAVYPGLQGVGLSTSSTVQLSYRRPQPSPDESDRDECKGQSRVCHGSSESLDGLIAGFPDVAPDIEEPQDDPQGPISDILCQSSENSPNGSPKSPQSLAPTVHLSQHAPRKSSLLRFAEAVSPDHPSPDPDEGRPVPVPAATPMRKKYKRRSHTYPYQSSERDSVAETFTQDQILDSLNRVSLDDSLEDAPFELPPAVQIAARTCSAQDIMFASPATESPSGNSSVHISTAGIAQPPLGRRRSSDVLGQMYFMTDMPSSPPLPRTPASDYFGQEPASPGSPRLPRTPTPIRNAATLPRTEPRPHRPQYLDGSSYTVYNDSLPAVSQPQTPADAARHPLITEQDAAYTAPPGMLRIGGSASVGPRGRQGWDQEAVQQSPTARAINMRERRNRELTRGVQAEGVRLQRLRMRDESRFTQRALEAEAAATGRDRAELVSPASDDMWRDELEADRVGDENFETGHSGSRGGVMRVVSGNARFDHGGWNG